LIALCGLLCASFAGCSNPAADSFYLPASSGAPDKAHFVKSGATEIAQLVAGEIRRIHRPLAAYLK
jgi:hypothetical protein